MRKEETCLFSLYEVLAKVLIVVMLRTMKICLSTLQQCAALKNKQV